MSTEIGAEKRYRTRGDLLREVIKAGLRRSDFGDARRWEFLNGKKPSLSVKQMFDIETILRARHIDCMAIEMAAWRHPDEQGRVAQAGLTAMRVGPTREWQESEDLWHATVIETLDELLQGLVPCDERARIGMRAMNWVLRVVHDPIKSVITEMDKERLQSDWPAYYDACYSPMLESGDRDIGLDPIVRGINFGVVLERAHAEVDLLRAETRAAANIRAARKAAEAAESMRAESETWGKRVKAWSRHQPNQAMVLGISYAVLAQYALSELPHLQHWFVTAAAVAGMVLLSPKAPWMKSAWQVPSAQLALLETVPSSRRQSSEDARDYLQHR